MNVVRYVRRYKNSCIIHKRNAMQFDTAIFILTRLLSISLINVIQLNTATNMKT